MMRSSPLRHPARLAGSSLLRLQSDERLAELVIAGHAAAFDVIVDRFRTPLQRYCAGIVGPSRAEDAVQQTLINAHDALRRTDEVRHLRSWLYRIAHNTSLNVLRSLRDDISLDDASGAALAASAADGPAASFERSEQFRATVQALQALPEHQRAALVLRELEGRSHEEIADALGVTKGSARQHLMRARTAMRAAVTAITPYPLIVRLAELLAAPGGAGWVDAAAGAGAGATLAKLTAGVVATGALVGAGVQTEHVVHHHGSEKAAKATDAPARKPVRGMLITLPKGGVTAGSASGSGASSRSGLSGDDRHGASGHGKDDSGRGSHGHDDEVAHGEDRSGRGGSGPGSGSGSGSGSGPGDDDSGRGSGGSDDGRRGSSDSGSSSSGPGRSNVGDGGRSSNSSGKGSSGSSSRGSSGSSGSSGSGESSPGSGRSGDDISNAETPAPTTTAATPITSSSGSGSSGSGSSSGESGSGESSGSGSGSGGSDSSGSSSGRSDSSSTTSGDDSPSSGSGKRDDS
jgi:RNA polymerase sigma factor (sigma-70 family)